MRVRVLGLVSALLLLPALATVASPLAPPAAAVDCGALSAADIAFGAPDLNSSSLDSCWDLPSATGDVLLLRSTNASPTDVLDADGVVQCSVTAESSAQPQRCELTGVAPFRTSVSRANLAIADLGASAGCGTFTPSPFGGPATDPLELQLEQPQIGCEAADLAAGPYRVVGSSGAPWTLYDADDQPLCQGIDESRCALPADGPVRAVLTDDGSYTQRLAVVPLAASTPGCGAMTTSWAEPAVEVGGEGGQPRVDCREFAGAAGQQVWPATSDQAAAIEVVDASGDAACEAVADLAGCTLEGGGPYRMLTWSTSSSGYRATVRDVSGMTGCPAVAETDFGTTASDTFPGVGCRRVEVSRTGTYFVNGTYSARRLRLLQPSGAVVCAGLPTGCRLSAGEPYLLVEDTVGKSGFRTQVHRLSAGACDPLRAGIAAQWSGRVTDRTAGCRTLDYPTGAVLTPVAAPGAPQPYLAVLDATGERQCVMYGEEYRCTLAGAPPYRVVDFYDDSARFTTALARLDEPTGCQPLRGGSWGTARGSVVTVPEGRVAACLTAPGRRFQGWSYVGWERRAGSSPTRVFVRDETDGYCEVEGEDSGFGTCTSSWTSTAPMSVIVTADRTGGRWKVVGRAIDHGAGCTAAGAARPGGPSFQDHLDDPLRFDCVEVTAADDDAYLAGLDGRSRGVTMDVFPVGFDRLCATDAYGDGCRFTGFDRYRLVVHREVGTSGSAPYRLEPVRVASGGEWDSRCRRFPDYTGVIGPFTSALSNRHAVDCLVMEDPDGRSGYTVTSRATDGSGGYVVPRVFSTDPWLDAGCYHVEDGTYRCGGFTSSVDDADGETGLLLLERRPGDARIEYRFRGQRL